MIILGLLQNQWLKDPERHQRFLLRHPESRRDLVGTLFLLSQSGRRWAKIFGELEHSFIFDNASREIGKTSCSCFKPDPAHILETVKEVKPDHIVAFGKVAGDALDSLGIAHLKCLHPAHRRYDLFKSQAAKIISRIQPITTEKTAQ